METLPHRRLVQGRHAVPVPVIGRHFARAQHLSQSQLRGAQLIIRQGVLDERVEQSTAARANVCPSSKQRHRQAISLSAQAIVQQVFVGHPLFGQPVRKDEGEALPLMAENSL